MLSSTELLVQLTNPLPGDTKAMVARSEQEVAGTVMDPAFVEAGLGCIHLPLPVLTVAGREVLWPEASYIREACLEDPPKELTTQKLMVPHIESFGLISSHFILHPILARADAVLQAVQSLARGQATVTDVRKAAARYQDQIVSELAGRGGLLNRAVLGVRIPRSARFVVVPDPTLGPDETAIPESVAYDIEASPGDLVVLSRAPVLWQGSVLIQRVAKRPGYAGALNPFIMTLIGADFDGDTVAVMKVPDNLACQREAEGVLGSTARGYATWSAEFLMWNAEPGIDWDGPLVDCTSRLFPDGELYTYTLSPKDVLEPNISDTIQNMGETGCKKAPVDLTSYANGLSRSNFTRVEQNVVAQTVRMKVELGVVGSITDLVAHAIYAIAPSLCGKALMLKEKLTQALLDSKHGLGAFDTFEIADLFNRYGSWSPEKSYDGSKAIAYLVDCGVDEEVAVPLVNALWSLDKGVRAIASEHMCLYSASKRPSRAQLLAIKEGRPDVGFMARIAQAVGIGGDLD